MARRHGKDGSVLADPTGGSTTVAIASLSSWSLDMARDKADVTAFADANKQYVLGLKDVSGSLSGWWDAADVTLFDIADGDEPAMLKLIPSTLDATFFWTGLAYLDASIEVPADGPVSVSSDFVAAGPWSREPAGV